MMISSAPGGPGQGDIHGAGVCRRMLQGLVRALFSSLPRFVPRSSFVTAATTALALVLVPAMTACDRAPSADGLKDWTPQDHEGEKRAPGANQGAKGDAGAGSAAATLADLTWRQQCSSCHGPAGHGDGPQGAMFKAPDLSREDWQSKVKDEEIAATIANGKNRMPKFELPEEVLRGLVGRVRSFRGR